MNVQITDPKEINRQINEIACELITLDFAYDSARIQTLKNSIMEKMYIFLQYNRGDKDNVEMFFCPLINKKLSVDEYDVFMSVLLWLLDYNKEKKKWNYNSEKSSFITAFKYYLAKRLFDEINKSRKRTQIETSFDAFMEGQLGVDDDYELNSALSEHNEFAFANGNNNRELVLYDAFSFNPFAVASLLHELAKALEHCKPKEQGGFKAFFSFDVTKGIKKLVHTSDNEAIDYVVKNNDCLFPNLLIKMLEYLMHGYFESVSDVIKNELRKGINFEKRQFAIEVVLGISHPTANKYSQRYEKFIISIKHKEEG